MLASYDPQAPKRATNLSINSDLLKKSKELGINLSAVLEQVLVEQVALRQQEAWLKENQKAIAAYNNHVAEHGVFSDGLRSF